MAGAGLGAGRGLRHALLLPVPLPGLPEVVSRFRWPDGTSGPGEAILSTGDLPRTDPYSFTPRRPALVRVGMGGGCPPPAPSIAPPASPESLFSMPPPSPPASGSGSGSVALDGNFLLACRHGVPAALPPATSIGWRGRTSSVGFSCWRPSSMPSVRAPPFRFRHAVEIAIFTALWANIHASFLLCAAHRA